MRNPHDKLLAGVCGGIADFLEADPKSIRLISLVVFVLPTAGVGPLLYVLLWLFLPVGTQQGGITRDPIIQSRKSDRQSNPGGPENRLRN